MGSLDHLGSAHDHLDPEHPRRLAKAALLSGIPHGHFLVMQSGVLPSVFLGRVEECIDLPEAERKIAYAVIGQAMPFDPSTWRSTQRRGSHEHA